MLNRLLLLSAFVTVTACGGGGSEGGAPVTTGSSTTTEAIATTTMLPPTTATSEDSTTTTTAVPPTYRVAFVERGNTDFGLVADVLFVQPIPGITSDPVGSVGPGEGIIIITGAPATENPQWVPIRSGSGVEGWVNSRYLVADIPGAAFCADQGPRDLVAEFTAALHDRSDPAITGLIDVRRGVWLSLRDTGPRGSISALPSNPFASPPREWFSSEGVSMTGTFGDIVAPRFLRVLGGSADSQCNEHTIGPASSLYGLHRGFADVNYLSYHVNGMGWESLLIGVDWVEGRGWVIVSIVYFSWTI